VIGPFKVPTEQYLDLTKKITSVQGSIEALNTQLANVPRTVLNKFEFVVSAGTRSRANPSVSSCGNSGALVGGSCMTFCPNQQPGIGPDYAQPPNSTQTETQFSCYRFSSANCDTQAFAVCLRLKQ
jgi:hypothetical protein